MCSTCGSRPFSTCWSTSARIPFPWSRAALPTSPSPTTSWPWNGLAPRPLFHAAPLDRSRQVTVQQQPPPPPLPPQVTGVGLGCEPPYRPRITDTLTTATSSCSAAPCARGPPPSRTWCGNRRATAISMDGPWKTITPLFKESPSTYPQHCNVIWLEDGGTAFLLCANTMPAPGI